MLIRLDSWGFVFETGYLDIYVQKNTLIFAVALYLAVVARRVYLKNKKRSEIKASRKSKTDA